RRRRGRRLGSSRGRVEAGEVVPKGEHQKDDQGGERAGEQGREEHRQWRPGAGADLDSLLIALYVTIDDLLGRPGRLPGRKPKLSDSELPCLAVAQVLLSCPPNTAGFASPWCGWAISSPTCPSSPATTSACRRSL